MVMMNFRSVYQALTVLAVVAVVLHVPEVTCYPKGAPVSACDTGLPLHEEDGVVFEPQTSPPPYIITADVSEFRAGDTLTITIDSHEGVPFRGLFMQVRPVPTDDFSFSDHPIGRFYRIVENSRPLTCYVSLETETHTDPFAKYNLTIQWKAPLLIRTDVVVRATLLANFSTFWANVESQRIKIIPQDSLPVEGLEKPWVREIIKTVSAEGDKKAARELVKARFEKGFQGLVEPHGYLMVHYVTDMLPFEASHLPLDTNGTTVLPTVRPTFTSALAVTSSPNITMPENTDTNETTTHDAVKQKTDTHSKRLHYEALVRTLLTGDKTVIDELTAVTDEM